jgi:DNA-directed RNA polymerase specialized sigma24 family protein
MDKNIIDVKFEEAMKNDKNQAIMSAIAKKYKNILSCEQIYECKLNAIWRCLEKHIDGKGNLFSSSLYNFMTWQCQTACQQTNRELLNKSRFLNMGDEQGKFPSLNTNKGCTELFDGLSADEKELLQKRYIGGKTLREISRDIGRSTSFVSQKINDILFKLRCKNI